MNWRTYLEQVWSDDEKNGSETDDGKPLPGSRVVSPFVVLLFIFLNNVVESFASLGSVLGGVGSLCLAGTWWRWSRLRNATSVFGQRFSVSRCQSQGHTTRGYAHGHRSPDDSKRHVDFRLFGRIGTICRQEFGESAKLPVMDDARRSLALLESFSNSSLIDKHQVGQLIKASGSVTMTEAGDNLFILHLGHNSHHFLVHQTWPNY